MILAAEGKAEELCDRPAWITGIDHRIDSHHFGVRNLSAIPSAKKAALNAGLHQTEVDLAELHTSYTVQDILLRKELNLPLNPEKSSKNHPIKAETLMASGLLRIAEAARAIWNNEASRTLAHATSGPLMQQNLMCVLSGEKE